VTFTSAALAVDGALTPGSLQRLGLRASVKQSGVINPGDLKVLPLAAPGAGVRISAGGAVLENRYVSNSGQSYVVENISEEIVDASSTGGFPATNPGVARSHLVCVTIGDPQYTTAGHAWLTDVNKPATAEDALDFQYVRAFVIQNVPAGVARVEDLPSPPPFPCYAIARLVLASNWTTITGGAQIVDLREVVNPREKLYEQHVATSSNDILTVVTLNEYEYWPDQSDIEVYIPAWATAVYCNGFIEGFQQPATANVKAAMRIFCQTAALGTTASKYADGQSGRKSINLGGKFSIPVGIRGTSQHFQIQATAQDTESQGKLTTDAWTTARVELRFVEEAV
jgi:hypothetical protein